VERVGADHPLRVSVFISHIKKSIDRGSVAWTSKPPLPSAPVHHAQCTPWHPWAFPSAVTLKRTNASNWKADHWKDRRGFGFYEVGYSFAVTREENYAACMKQAALLFHAGQRGTKICLIDWDLGISLSATTSILLMLQYCPLLSGGHTGPSGQFALSDLWYQALPGPLGE
jgi:hypothetical protein